jgi:hypothetical protein
VSWIAAAILLVRWLMKATIVCIALVLCTPAYAAAESAGVDTAPNHRVSLSTRLACPAIREAVKLYGQYAAEQWARSHGVSEAKIARAKQCLR